MVNDPNQTLFLGFVWEEENGRPLGSTDQRSAGDKVGEDPRSG